MPFSSIFIDYIGPVSVKLDGRTRKVWLLIITCLWSRAVSLQICFSADTADFLNAPQQHVHRYGIFRSCLSDLGSQICAGAKLIEDFLNDVDCYEYLQLNGIEKISFNQYPKGNSSLGSIVECCVKQVKALINKSISKNILSLDDFQFLISKAAHIINRRPIAFKEGLRNSGSDFDVSPITPNYGRELVSANIIPTCNLMA